MPNEEKMMVDHYLAVYEIARPRITDFARRIGLNKEDPCGFFDHWIFGSGGEIHVMLYADGRISVSSLWRISTNPKDGQSSPISLYVSFHPECRRSMLKMCYQCKQTSGVFA
jgi:hypothetical protein